MLSAKTVFEEIFDNDEAFRLFCSEVGVERAELAWHALTTRRTTSSSPLTGYDHLTHKELLIQVNQIRKGECNGIVRTADLIGVAGAAAGRETRRVVGAGRVQVRGPAEE